VVDSRDREAALLLLLLDAPTIGPRRLLTLLETQGSGEAVRSWLLSAASTSHRVREFIAGSTIDIYEQSIEETYRLGGKFLLWSDPTYPSNLRKWEGRPPVLFYKGNLANLAERSLALVGRVDPSDGGLEAAHRFARKCVDQGITVISGLAKGIDGASHRAALEEPPGYTYAVVGHGLDYAYPRENRSLYSQIPSNGAVISQFRTGVGPQRWTFPARNEVMCTLALGTVIVEGKTGCGSIIQADFSFKHGRPVFLLAKNLTGNDVGWAQDLVRRGAHVIERFDQVLAVVDKVTKADDETSTSQVTLFEVPQSRGLPKTITGYNERSSLVSEASGQPGAPVALFDLDGVIVDSRDATAAAIARIAETHTGRSIEPAEVEIATAPHKALEKLGVANAYAVYRREYDDAFLRNANRVRVFEEVVTALATLRASGIRLGAVTAQPRRRAMAMVPAEIRQMFDRFLSYNETGGKKEVGIAACLREFQATPQDAVFIGDTPSDLEAARRAGVRGVGVLWGFSSEAELRRWPHDMLISRQSEITPALIRDLVK